MLFLIFYFFLGLAIDSANYLYVACKKSYHQISIESNRLFYSSHFIMVFFLLLLLLFILHCLYCFLLSLGYGSGTIVKMNSNGIVSTFDPSNTNGCPSIAIAIDPFTQTVWTSDYRSVI
jgi:hypothetical protein